MIKLYEKFTSDTLITNAIIALSDYREFLEEKMYSVKTSEKLYDPFNSDLKNMWIETYSPLNPIDAITKYLTDADIKFNKIEEFDDIYDFLDIYSDRLFIIKNYTQSRFEKQCIQNITMLMEECSELPQITSYNDLIYGCFQDLIDDEMLSVLHSEKSYFIIGDNKFSAKIYPCNIIKFEPEGIYLELKNPVVEKCIRRLKADFDVYFDTPRYDTLQHNISKIIIKKK